MKFTKIFLFTILAIFSLGFIYNEAQAITGSGSVTVTVNPINGGWTAWGGWSTCSLTCEGGTQTSTRTCTNPKPEGTGAKDCSGIDGGNPSKTQSCNEFCCSPTTQKIEVACDLKNGVAATSGLVTRSQSKSDYPGCAFGTPVTVDNSTYVTDDCKYPEVSVDCSAPLTKNTGGFACDKNAEGKDAISGSVTRGQTKVAPSCTFETPITVDNSYWVSDNCEYPTGKWSYPTSCPTACGKAQSTQTETCTGGNGICSGTASTRTCNATAACPPNVCPAPSFELKEVFNCPSGYTGSITQKRDVVGAYPGCAFGGWYDSVDGCTPVVINVCPAPSFELKEVFNCPSGYTGSTTQERDRGTYPNCAFGSWYQTYDGCDPIATICIEPKDTNYNIGPCLNTCKNGADKTTYPTCTTFPVSMFGTLTPSTPTCDIALNGSSCNVNLTWTVTNPLGSTTKITANGMTDYTSPSVSGGGPRAFIVPYSSRTFYLYNNGEPPLATATATAFCVSGTGWSSSEGKCIVGDGTGGDGGTGNGTGGNGDGDGTGGDGGTGNGTNGNGGNVLNINFTAIPSKIFKGKSSVLAWTSTLGANCTAVSAPEFGIFSTGTDNPYAGNTTVYPTKTTRYKISCTKSNITETDEVTVQVNSISVIEI